MKRTRIQFVFLIMFSIILGSIALPSNMSQVQTSVANSNEEATNLQEVSEESSPLSEFDLEKIAEVRNAQVQQSKQVSRGSQDQKELIGEFKLTFYTPSPDETDNTPLITANGTRVKPGVTVAVDPRYWKLGTKFYIEGYGYVVAEDTGSKILGPRAMDVCVETKDEAFKNGIQYRNVWVVNS